MDKLNYYRAVSPNFWTDHKGRRWPVSKMKTRLKYQIKSHAALRVFVFYRDSYKCQECGIKADFIPPKYDGRNAISCKNWCLVLDHIRSVRNGGSHHPDNLKTLCSSCNTRKVGLEDKKFVR